MRSSRPSETRLRKRLAYSGIILLTLVGCLAPISRAGAQGNGAAPQKKAVGGLETEAQNAARLVWQSQFKKCVEYYYNYDVGYQSAYQNVPPTVYLDGEGDLRWRKAPYETDQRNGGLVPLGRDRDYGHLLSVIFREYRSLSFKQH